MTIPNSKVQISEPAPRELVVLPIACHFYGKAIGANRFIDTYGNQCALITESHSPCQMEIASQTPDEKICPLVLRIFGSADRRTSEGPE